MQRIAEQTGKATLERELTLLHGVTNPVTFEGKLIGTGPNPRSGFRRGYSGSVRIKRADYGINHNLRSCHRRDGSGIVGFGNQDRAKGSLARPADGRGRAGEFKGNCLPVVARNQGKQLPETDRNGALQQLHGLHPMGIDPFRVCVDDRLPI